MPILGVHPPARPAMSSHAQRMPETDSPATIRDRGAVGAVLLDGEGCRRAGGGVRRDAGARAPAVAIGRSGMVAFGATVVVIGDFFADGGLGGDVDPQGAPSDGRGAANAALRPARDGDPPRARSLRRSGYRPARPGLSPRSWRARFRCSRCGRRMRSLSNVSSTSRPSRRSSSPSHWSTTAGRSAPSWLGWGVWGLASAAIVRALTGSVLMTIGVAT